MRKQPEIRVLIVDDNEEVRRDLQTILQMTAGIEVVGMAENGQEAVEQVRSLNPDIVLMDAEMPVMNGLEATGKIKSLDLGTGIIILSVHSGELMARKVGSSDADGFVVKGSPFQTLQSVVVDVFKKKRTKGSGMHGGSSVLPGPA